MTNCDLPFDYIDLYSHDGVIVGVCHCGAFVDFTDWEENDYICCPQCGQEWSDIDNSDIEEIPVEGEPEEKHMAGTWVGEGGGVNRRIDLIVIHCSATPPTMNIGAADIKKWHLARNFNDIGYHRVIKRDGTIEFGRADIIPGAHAAGHNQFSLAVCLVGGVDKNHKPEANYTPAQWEALRMVVYDWSKKYRDAKIVGHRDLPKVDKACPSFDVATWLACTFSNYESA